MKKASVIFLCLVLFFVATMPANAAAQEKPVIRQVGDTGKIEIVADPERGYFASRLDNWECEIYSGGHSYWAQFGAITAATKVTVINRKVDREDFDLLNGKEAVLYGRIRCTGKGEGEVREWLELNIFITDPL